MGLSCILDSDCSESDSGRPAKTQHRQPERLLLPPSSSGQSSASCSLKKDEEEVWSRFLFTAQNSQQMMDWKELAAQKLSLSRLKKPRPATEASGPPGFSGALQLSPPAVPPCLLRARSKVKDASGMGKVRVMVRICSAQNESSESTSFLKVNGCRKQLTLCQTESEGQSGAVQKRSSASAPKTFTFDGVFSQDASQAEVCSGTVMEVIQSVMKGADGCIFCYGHANLGKTYTMIGRQNSAHSLGVVPTSISWLFKVLQERQEKAGLRFSVQVSAVEISGREETLTDLLADLRPSSSSSSRAQQEAPGPGVSLREDPICGSQLQNQTVLMASSADRAAFFLDVALAARRSSRMPSNQEVRRNSHFLFTLHLQQEKTDKSNSAAMSGACSRLHLLDLGSCEMDISWTREGGGRCLSLSALGSVIFALANGAKHVPYGDSKLAMLLSQSLGNINCRTTMIAHVSAATSSSTETLSTLLLASRILCSTKNKSMYASSSTGGESSCEEGHSHRPRLSYFHPRTIAFDSDTNPDYSSSSEHSCDTVVYVGPGGTAVSDHELSDSEGLPAFVPIVPSLVNKQVKDAARSDGDRLKCNTFAELQERLECIDGSEVSAMFAAEAKAAPKNSSQNPSESTNTPDQEQNRFPFRRTSADVEKVSARPAFLQDSEPAVPEKLYLKGSEPSALPSVSGTPKADTSQQALRQSDVKNPCHRSPSQVNLLGRRPHRDVLRTTFTMQQPVELNGKDELVFTVVEELPVLVPDNKTRTRIFNFNSDSSHQEPASSCHPVSIISSINDEFDAYTSQQGATDDDATKEVTISADQTSAGSWPSEANMNSAECGATPSMNRLFLRNKSTAEENFSTLPPPSAFRTEMLHASLNDSDPATLQKSSFISIPLSLKTFRGSDARAGTVSAQIPHHNVSAHSSLPRKTKPTSSCSGHGEVWLQRSSSPLRNGMSSMSSKSPGRSSNSIPRPPKVSSAAQRTVDGCEKSCSRRGDALIEMPRLTRGAMTLGMISVPGSSEPKRGYNGTLAAGSLRFSSLGKKSNGLKCSVILKSRSGNVSPLAPLVRQPSHDQKTRTVLCPSGLRTSADTGKSSLPKTSEEEFKIRADSFSHKTSSLKTEFVSVKTSPGLKTRGARADSPRFADSLMSLERRDSLTSDGSKPGTSGGSAANGRSSRSVPRLELPASTSAPMSSFSPSQSPAGVSAAAIKQGQVKGWAAVSAGSKARTLSASSSKSLGSSTKPPDGTAGRQHPAGKSAPGTGPKPGRGTVTKQVVNSRVSELAAGGLRKQFSRRSEVTGNEGRDNGTRSVGASPIDMPLPSPYSKITAPRRPQCYSSGHGSDNSSVLSGELPPAMGRTALFYHSGGSSGYESVIRDGETTGSASSAHDSMSESGTSLTNRSRASKSPKKRGNGESEQKYEKQL
ncbi:hypothetical protein LDENG_00104760 [Lucifuga dentata]|nr:hypothetical protein LDENG_00104760 [Lucifuga dentata]